MAHRRCICKRYDVYYVNYLRDVALGSGSKAIASGPLHTNL
jgi:hypothetical protein